MAILLRSHVFASTVQRTWIRPFSLVIFRSSFHPATYSQIASTEYPTQATRSRGYRPQLASKIAERALLLQALQSHWIGVRRFGSVPSSLQAKNRGPSKRSGRDPLPPQYARKPIEVKHRKPAVRSYPSPAKLCEPPTESLPASTEHTAPRAESTRSAVHWTMTMNLAVFGAWIFSLSDQICIYERCVPGKCTHKLCGRLQWMFDNALNSSDNLRAHRYWTLVTSSFSHYKLDHLLANMLCLSVFAPALYNAGGIGIGALHVVGLTVGSAVLGSLTYIVYRRNWQAPSLCKGAVDVRMNSCCGASDVASAFATVATCLRPIRSFAVGCFFLPSWMCFLTGSMIF